MIKQLKENWHYGVGIMATIYNIWMTIYASVNYEPHLKSLNLFYFGGAIMTGSLLFFIKSMNDNEKKFKINQISEGTK